LKDVIKYIVGVRLLLIAMQLSCLLSLAFLTYSRSHKYLDKIAYFF